MIMQNSAKAFTARVLLSILMPRRSVVMNRSVSVGLTVFLVLGLTAGPSVGARKLPPIPSTACPMIAPAEAPTVDGSADEAVWAKAPANTSFGRGDGAAGHRLEFRVLCDGQWLYLAITGYEKQIVDAEHEIVGIFIAPSKISDQYMRLSVHLTEKQITKRSTLRFRGGDDDWRTVHQMHKDRWVLEVALRVPSVFGVAPSEGEAFDLNVARTRMRIDSDVVGIYQQWSHTGISETSRYRFGEIVFGDLADRLRVVLGDLQQTVETTNNVAAGVSERAQSLLTDVHGRTSAFLRSAQAVRSVTPDRMREVKAKAAILDRELRRAVLVDRGVIIWSCNAMEVPHPSDLPAPGVESAKRLDIRVLGDEWESAAIVVTNLTDQTLDGQVILTDFVTADGKLKAPGWDVLQVRTAPLYTLETGRKLRDPLPRLQEGDLFRAAPDENELLWLTFKSRGLAPGRYTSKMTVRSLDDVVQQEIELVLRVYPVKLGAEGRPKVNVWNSMLRGSSWEEKVQNVRDYYHTESHISSWDEVPFFTADVDGNILDDELDFAKYDKGMDKRVAADFDHYLIRMATKHKPFWPVRRENGSVSFNFKQWSPKYRELFRTWLLAFRDHMAEKGLPCDKWAFYIVDEPAAGEQREQVRLIAKAVREIDPNIMTYVTLPPEGAPEEMIEMSKYLRIIQTPWGLRPSTFKRIKANVDELWHYSVCSRRNPYFSVYRRSLCWDTREAGFVGTGFWVWDSQSQYDFLWRDKEGTIFPAVYGYLDRPLVTSLRAEAFREGIEDWKYVLMLDDAIARAKDAGVDAAVVAAAQKYRNEDVSSPEDAAAVYRFRDQARGHLIALHVALGDVDRQLVEAAEAD